MIEIVRAGLATTFQDRGRPGLAHLGISGAGAVDRDAAALVNRLVGNEASAAVLETVGGLEIRAVTSIVVAAGPEFAPVTLTPGGRYSVAAARGRVWQYLAVRGGFDVAPVLGSRSFDTMAGLGPPPPAVGDRIGVGQAVAGPVFVDQAPVAELPGAARLDPGPRRDWFTDDAWRLLTSAEWVVESSSRVGARLTGPRLARSVADELPSEGLVRGAIQVPPDGRPVVMLADHPTTGGYPVIAVVHPDDVVTIAERSATSPVRFGNYG